MLRVVRASHYVLTCIDNNYLAVAARYNLLANGKPSTLIGEKEAHLKIWGMAHYHPPRSRLFQN